ncbi:MAG: Na(+)-translocating NADH-quinone reductase subunit C [Melioribacteraceae bacterium]|nr:Na(+)-translocating NADH-quinone reductase subunit C [Melioribacteraceae bacterium]
MPKKDSTKKTLLVALGVCFVASILVSTAAVGLKPLQEKNKKLDLLKNILSAGNLYKEGIDIEKTFNEKITAKIIDLKTGETIPESKFDDELSIEKFNINKLASSSKWGTVTPKSNNDPGLKRIPKVMAIYTVMKNDKIDKYILPIYGKGLWSTMYGFIAIDKDLHTIKGFTFYLHGETPGLGGEVDNPNWKKQWIGKQAYDKDGNIKIEVIKGIVDRSSDKAKFQVDGIAGSTLTARGVNNLVRFWLTENGYAPFLNKLKGDKNG